MKVNFNKNQINILAKLTKKNYYIAKSGNLFFDFGKNGWRDIIKFQKTKDGYVIRRSTCSSYMNFITFEHPLNYNRNTGKYKFKTFESMLSYFITYLDKYNYELPTKWKR